MKSTKQFLFLKNANAIATSNVCYSVNCADNIVLQTTGDATSYNVVVEGSVEADGDNWIQLSLVKMSDLSVINAITANGIYVIPSLGMYKIRLRLTAVSGGSVNAFGRIGE